MTSRSATSECGLSNMPLSFFAATTKAPMGRKVYVSIRHPLVLAEDTNKNREIIRHKLEEQKRGGDPECEHKITIQTLCTPKDGVEQN